MDPAGLDGLLADTRRALEDMRTGTPPPGGTAERLTGTGEAAEGRVRATAVSGGRVESLDLDPRALRLGSQELAAEILSAVNAALDDLRSQVGSTGELGPVDVTDLADRLADLQAEAARGMAVFSQGIAETVARIQSAAG